MMQRTQKIIMSVVNLVLIGATFQALIYILNLNQVEIFFRTAFIIGFFYILQVILLYDLHFKNRGAFGRAILKHETIKHKFKRACRTWTSAFWDRIEHLRKWDFVKQWLVYLILPAIIFWSTISIFYIHLGFLKIQEIFAILSTIALFLHYFFVREIFSRKSEEVDGDIFVILSVVKIYASAIMYGASIALIKRYCLDSGLLEAGIFALTFLIIWQALYQHKLTTITNLLYAMLIAAFMSQLGRFVLIFWGYNHFTAAIFLATCYNFLWGVFHYKLDRALTWKALLEILVVSIIILGMIFSVTNFKARLLNDCNYQVVK